MPFDVKMIWVLGPWSSGSTALTGWIARLGAWTCPPHQITNDPRTRDSYESKELRDRLCQQRNELTLETKVSATRLDEWFISWRADQEEFAFKNGYEAIALKHPLICYNLDLLYNPKSDIILTINRPLKEIEKTRQRRQWHKIYGIYGAKKIYGKIYSDLLNRQAPYTPVMFDRFKNDLLYREQLGKNLLHGFKPSDWEKAEAWLKK